MTEEEARDEFYNLMNDDPDFQAQWEDAFYEWCSVYDDTTDEQIIKKWKDEE